MSASKQREGARLLRPLAIVIAGLTMLMIVTRAAASGTTSAGAGAPPLGLMSAGSTTTSAEVAQDGRPGSFPTITLALEHAPPNISVQYIVVIRKGRYPETVTVVRPNVRLVGDGMGVTVITAAHSKRTGRNTQTSATVSVYGEGFMAQDLTIENTAGVDAEQAVALRLDSHKSVCYRCELRGFQDTLWAATGDQFYRSCVITGTVDFVFGNARALFQDCKVMVRRGHDHNVVTAQGRDGPDHRSGFVFQACSVTSDGDDQDPGSTFLGRPWRDHSHVVFRDSFLDDVVNREGWEQWNLTSKVPKTVYYAEFNNPGPGADTSGRVNWTAFHLLNYREATSFTVRAFLQDQGGDEWLRHFPVPYY